MSEQMKQINSAVAYIQSQSNDRPQIAIVLGSGLGSLADEVDVDQIIHYEDIPGFPVSTVPGHAGHLIMGSLLGKKVVVMKGRFHYYEGYPMQRIALPIRVLHALGAKALIVTNAAGGLNPGFDPGDVMLITDHINMMGANPLMGDNDEDIGPRFPDLTFAYAPDLLALASKVAERNEILLRQGVYIGVHGPSFETKAERRFLRVAGGDAVGMSTVPEVIVAHHAGMRVLGFSAVTNIATGELDQPPDSHEHVLAMAQIAGEKLVTLVRQVIKAMPSLDYLEPEQLVDLLKEEPKQLSSIIDHTLLKPDATSQQIQLLCEESLEYSFASVCINPIHVKQALGLLDGSDVKIGTVIGFPLGAYSAEDKVRETQESINDGASEVDMVINIGALKEGNDSMVEAEIAQVVQAAHVRGVHCKVIIEAGLLNDEEKVRACLLAKSAGADFVKTSTGFMAGGATTGDVALMRETVGPHIGVKAAGGIRTLDQVMDMIEAGANRIGTSAGVTIISEIPD